MRLHNFLFALPLAVLLTGCAPVDSLNPLYTGKDITFDESLLGQWGGNDQGLNFTKLGENGYRIVMSAKDDETGQIAYVTFDAHLVQLQGHRFLDMQWKSSGTANDSEPLPEVHITRTNDGLQIEPHLIHTGPGAYLELLPGESDGNDDRYSIRPRQAHEFFKVVMEDEGRTMKLAPLDDSWVDAQIALGNLVIDHETMEGKSAVLTASTPDLQQLVLDHMNDEEAFRGETIVHRLAADLLQ